MPNHAYHATAAPGVVQRARSTKAGRKLERGGYLTAETVTMWIVYALTLLGNAIIEGGQVGGTTSADIAYGVFTWFTPAGYVFAIWSLIYIAMIVWLVAYTRTAPTRPDRFTMTSVLFIASCALNVLWLALWHFELVAVSFIVILAEWFVLAALYLNVRRTMMFLEESVKNAAKAYVFEPNVAATWMNVRSMIDNFLRSVWKRG